jgi:hypothetical protein
VEWPILKIWWPFVSVLGVGGGGSCLLGEQNGMLFGFQ